MHCFFEAGPLLQYNFSILPRVYCVLICAPYVKPWPHICRRISAPFANGRTIIEYRIQRQARRFRLLEHRGSPGMMQASGVHSCAYTALRQFRAMTLQHAGTQESQMGIASCVNTPPSGPGRHLCISLYSLYCQEATGTYRNTSPSASRPETRP